MKGSVTVPRAPARARWRLSGRTLAVVTVPPAEQSLVLADDGLVLRPLHRRDRREWQELLVRNASWLGPWLAGSPAPGRPLSFREQLAAERRERRAGTGLRRVVQLDGVLVGAIMAHPITRGATWTASLGYWVAEEAAGHGVAPRAVAVLTDHLLDELHLHRVEIDVRPDNGPSLRVVEKLGFVEEGRRRGLMFVDGAWRDHRSFALLAGDLGAGPGAVLRHLRQAADR